MMRLSYRILLVPVDSDWLMMIITRIFLITILVFSKFLLIMDSHNIVYWNCRGVSSRDTISRILHMLKKFKPIIFCLVETRTDDARLSRFYSNIENRWHWAAIVANVF